MTDLLTWAAEVAARYDERGARAALDHARQRMPRLTPVDVAAIVSGATVDELERIARRAE